MRYIILEESPRRVKVLDKHDNLTKEFERDIFTHLAKRANLLPKFSPPYKGLIRQVYLGELSNEEFLEKFLKETLINE
jgi:hypothetical protein